MRRSPAASFGFTILEMATVVTIMGLLVGSILAGRTLIRQAQLQHVVSDVQRYKTAVKAFQQKYAALPGDMTNAVAIWGAAGGGSGDNYTTSCYASQGTGTQTCNGNGDGQVAYYLDGGTYGWEGYRTWQHLALSGLLEGSFTGVQGSGGATDAEAGQNMPASAVGKGVYVFGYLGMRASGDVNLFPTVNYAHAFALSGSGTGNSPPLKPTDAASIDVKIDNGLPASGLVLANRSNSGATPCTNTDNMANSTTVVPAYATTGTANCRLYFISGF